MAASISIHRITKVGVNIVNKDGHRRVSLYFYQEETNDAILEVDCFTNTDFVPLVRTDFVGTPEDKIDGDFMSLVKHDDSFEPRTQSL